MAIPVHGSDLAHNRSPQHHGDDDHDDGHATRNEVLPGTIAHLAHQATPVDQSNHED